MSAADTETSQRFGLVMSGLVAAWFVSSAACTASSKRMLLELAPHVCAMLLTAMQFALAGLLSSIPLMLRGFSKQITRDAWPLLFATAFVYAAGFLLLNLALVLLHASFAETVRGLEPLFAVILVRICRARGRSISGRAALGLLSLLVGAAFTCLAQKHLSWLGLLLGLGSNLMFALRSLLTTQLQDKLEMSTGARLDASALFCYQHIIGLGLVAPLALANGGWHCARALGRNPTSLFFGALSSVCFYAYNRLSLAVLLMLNALAHSVANSLRRAVTIGFAAVAFRTQISPLAASGIVLIIGGSLLYALGAVSPRPVQPIDDMESAEESPDLPAADATKATEVHVDDRGGRRAAPETRALLAQRADGAEASAPS